MGNLKEQVDEQNLAIDAQQALVRKLNKVPGSSLHSVAHTEEMGGDGKIYRILEVEGRKVNINLGTDEGLEEPTVETVRGTATLAIGPDGEIVAIAQNANIISVFDASHILPNDTYDQVLLAISRSRAKKRSQRT